jgi:membrane protein required for colicin V production
MNIYDWAVVGLVVAFSVRGWFRGFVRELIDVAVLLVGAVLVFRLSPAVGTIISAMANLPYEAARIAAGVVMLAVLFVGATLVANLVSGTLRIVPGATVLNRLGGVGAGVVYAAVVVILLTTVVGVAPLPTGMRGTVDEAIAESSIGRTITQPDGDVQLFVGTASGQALFASVLSIRQVVGDRLAAGTIPIPIPSVARGDLTADETVAMHVLEGVNVARVEAGQNPLVWSKELSVVATSRAKRVYQSGSLSLDDRLDADLTGASVPGTIHSEGVVIGASPEGLVEAVLTATTYKAAIVDPIHRKAGIGVIDGPFGRVAVFIVSG